MANLKNTQKHKIVATWPKSAPVEINLFSSSLIVGHNVFRTRSIEDSLDPTMEELSAPDDQKRFEENHILP